MRIRKLRENDVFAQKIRDKIRSLGGTVMDIIEDEGQIKTVTVHYGESIKLRKLSIDDMFPIANVTGEGFILTLRNMNYRINRIKYDFRKIYKEDEKVEPEQTPTQAKKIEEKKDKK